MRRCRTNFATVFTSGLIPTAGSREHSINTVIAILLSQSVALSILARKAGKEEQ